MRIARPLPRRRVLALAAGLATLRGAAPAAAQQVPGGILIATEAMPVGDPLAPPSPAPPYPAVEAATRQAALLVPDAARAVGVDPTRLETQVIVGGAFLETAPTLLLRTRLDWGEAERLSAALGFVFRSPGVIAAELGVAEGDSAYALVSLPQARPTPMQAQAFFDRAAQVTEGLGTSYLALAEGLLFVNLRDPDGSPISGLDDENFVTALGDAAATARARLTATGTARARVVWNDWLAAPDGDDHLQRAGPAAGPALRALRDRHDAILRAVPRPTSR